MFSPLYVLFCQEKSCIAAALATGGIHVPYDIWKFHMVLKSEQYHQLLFQWLLYNGMALLVTIIKLCLLSSCKNKDIDKPFLSLALNENLSSTQKLYKCYDPF